VRNLVELHGGSIAAHSDGEGRGATFTVRLPALQLGRHARAADAVAARRQRTDIEAAPAQAPLQGAVVLIVDDEPDGRALLGRLMKDAGAEVREAPDAPAAIEILRRGGIDVILSDISMPAVDGFELMRRVRALQDPAVRDTPAIAVTAYARQEDRERSLAAGFQRHVAKPYSFTALTAVVGKVLENRRGRQLN
jgi:CheY-like chemotaxis protein